MQGHRSKILCVSLADAAAVGEALSILHRSTGFLGSLAALAPLPSTTQVKRFFIPKHHLLLGSHRDKVNGDVDSEDPEVESVKDPRNARSQQ